jgi:hypothetical protein
MNPGYKIEKTVGTGTAGTSVMDLMGMMYNIIRGSLMGFNAVGLPHTCSLWLCAGLIGRDRTVIERQQ